MATKTGINITNEVIIISGFPGIGKTTAAERFSTDPLYHIEDIDSATFKAGLKDQKNWASKYAEFVERTYDDAIQRKRDFAAFENTTVVLLVSAHTDVRDELNKRRLRYYYVTPAASAVHTVLEGVKKRAEETPTPANVRAYDALKNNGDRFVAEAIADAKIGTRPYETLIQLDKDYWLSALIYESTEYSVDTVCDNLMYPTAQLDMQERLTRLMINLLIYKKCTPDYAYLDTDGRVVVATKPLSPKKLIKVLRKAGVPIDNVAHCAFAGTNMVMLEKSQFMELYDASDAETQRELAKVRFQEIPSIAEYFAQLCNTDDDVVMESTVDSDDIEPEDDEAE